MRQRRRAERQNIYAESRLSKSGNENSEQFRQRLLIWFGAIVAVSLILWLALGTYFSSFRPPRQTVAEVAGQNIQLRDLVPASRIMAAALAASGQQSAIFEPRESLELLVGNKVLSQSVEELGITPPATIDVNAVLARAFQSARLGESSRDGLGELGQSRYSEFLLGLGVNDTDYREYIAGDIMRKSVNEYFKAKVPDEQEAVNLSWIVASSSIDAQKAWTQIIEGQPFEKVASIFNKEYYYSNESGILGWVPRGAFPEFDAQTFEAEKGQIIGPINSSLGFVVLQVNELPASKQISQELHDMLVRRQADDWFTQKTSDLISFVDFDQNDADWLISKLR